MHTYDEHKVSIFLPLSMMSAEEMWRSLTRWRAERQEI